MAQKLTKVETFKGYDIFYDSSTSHVVAKHKKLKNKRFKANYVDEVKRYILDDKWVNISPPRLFYRKDGVFHNRLLKVKVTEQNTETKEYKGEIVDGTESYYSDRDDRFEANELYPANKGNTSIYKKVEALSDEKDLLERKQKGLVANLRK